MKLFWLLKEVFVSFVLIKFIVCPEMNTIKYTNLKHNYNFLKYM